MKILISMALLGFCLLDLPGAMADSIALLPWSISITGNGSGSVSTNGGPDQLYFGIYNTASGTQGEWGYATSASSLAAITSNTIYVLSTSASLNGPGGGGMALLANGSGIAGTTVHTPTGVFSNYTVSFTTGGPEDSHIGQDLKLQFYAGSNLSGGGAQATFNSIRVSALSSHPTLIIHQSSATQVQISWPNVYAGFTLESAAAINDSWSAVSEPVVSQSTDFVVSIDMTSWQQRFFRLRK